MMWSVEDTLDIFKGNFPYYLLIAFPILLIISPNPVAGSVEFSVFRLQQFELHGNTYGSQNSLVNVEARTLDSGSIARRCILVRIQDLSPTIYQRIISEGAISVLVMLPSSFSNLSHDQFKSIWNLEDAMIDAEVQMAVYFAYETEELTAIYDSVRTFTNTDRAESAAAALLSSLSSDGYQMVVGGSQSKKLTEMTIANIQGRLVGFGVEEHLPTVAIIAHYDSFSASPDLAWGADSNGSGVVALLEILRILSKLYSSPRTHPRMNLVFLLSGGGFFNYQGSKRFLEDQLDASDSPLLSELHFALCLDTLSNGPSLNLHVSKKPNENSAGHSFFNTLESVGNDNGVKVEMVHKKINLQDDKQSWEHEKFSIRRLPAFTLSRLQNPKSGERGSITDTYEALDKKALKIRVSTIVAALIQHVYNKTIDDVLQDGLAVTEESIDSWLALLSSQPRAAQLVGGKSNSLVTSLHQSMNRYAHEVKVTQYKADRRDPEWVFYDATKAEMTAYAVKPASFDFLLTLVIGSYLTVIYFILQYFPTFFSAMYKLSSGQKLKSF